MTHYTRCLVLQLILNIQIKIQHRATNPCCHMSQLIMLEVLDMLGTAREGRAHVAVAHGGRGRGGAAHIGGLQPELGNNAARRARLH